MGEMAGQNPDGLKRRLRQAVDVVGLTFNRGGILRA